VLAAAALLADAMAAGTDKCTDFVRTDPANTYSISMQPGAKLGLKLSDNLAVEKAAAHLVNKVNVGDRVICVNDVLLSGQEWKKASFIALVKKSSGAVSVWLQRPNSAGTVFARDVPQAIAEGFVRSLAGVPPVSGSTADDGTAGTTAFTLPARFLRVPRAHCAGQACSLTHVEDVDTLAGCRTHCARSEWCHGFEFEQKRCLEATAWPLPLPLPAGGADDAAGETDDAAGEAAMDSLQGEELDAALLAWQQYRVMAKAAGAGLGDSVLEEGRRWERAKQQVENRARAREAGAAAGTEGKGGTDNGGGGSDSGSRDGAGLFVKIRRSKPGSVVIVSADTRPLVRLVLPPTPPPSPGGAGTAAAAEAAAQTAPGPAATATADDWLPSAGIDPNLRAGTGDWLPSQGQQWNPWSGVTSADEGHTSAAPAAVRAEAQFYEKAAFWTLATAANALYAATHGYEFLYFEFNGTAKNHHGYDHLDTGEQQEAAAGQPAPAKGRAAQWSKVLLEHCFERYLIRSSNLLPPPAFPPTRALLLAHHPPAPAPATTLACLRAAGPRAETRSAHATGLRYGGVA
jgi:hypothetical protein